jgi:hypothetical protein
MAKLSEMILNKVVINEMQYPRRTSGYGRTKNLNLGTKMFVQSGRGIYRTKQGTKPVSASTEEELEKKRIDAEKRAAAKKAREDEKNELIRLRAEKEAKENLDKEAELKQKELDLKQKEKEEELKRKQDEAAARNKELYDKMISQNEKRQEKYSQDVAKVKSFETIQKQEEKKEKPRSSGLLSTATRSLRF